MTVPIPVPPPSPVSNANETWFRRMPNGGTVFQREVVTPALWFRRCPTGGTAFHRPHENEENE